jgi:hypothetical protein
VARGERSINQFFKTRARVLFSQCFRSSPQFKLKLQVQKRRANPYPENQKQHHCQKPCFSSKGLGGYRGRGQYNKERSHIGKKDSHPLTLRGANATKLKVGNLCIRGTCTMEVMAVVEQQPVKKHCALDDKNMGRLRRTSQAGRPLKQLDGGSKLHCPTPSSRSILPG